MYEFLVDFIGESVSGHEDILISACCITAIIMIYGITRCFFLLFKR